MNVIDFKLCWIPLRDGVTKELNGHIIIGYTKTNYRVDRSYKKVRQACFSSSEEEVGYKYCSISMSN